MTLDRWGNVPRFVHPDEVPAVKPPERGDRVVWTIKRARVTCGLSEGHRYMGDGQTFCMERIPKDAQRLVSTDLLDVPPCKRCDVLHANGAEIADAFRSLVDEAMKGAA